MIDMARKDIIPAVVGYVKELSQTIAAKKSISSDICCDAEEDILKKLSKLLSEFYTGVAELENALLITKNNTDNIQKLSMCYKDNVLSAMNKLRVIGDEMEENTSSAFWPYPSYGEMLFSI